jgi:predicted metal-dependent phosphoesterase TrpH
VIKIKRYDLHVHSKVSKCSNLDYLDILKIAKKKGLNGIAITDHNSIQGALKIKELNKDKDFEVIIGSELKTKEGVEILAYYLKEEIKSTNMIDVINQIHKQGGIASFSHPFDPFRCNVNKKNISFKKIDALEAFNGRALLNLFNIKAKSFALKNHLPIIAGSDAHFSFEIGKAYTIFEGDLRKAVKYNKTKVDGTNIQASLGYIKTIINKYYKN